MTVQNKMIGLGQETLFEFKYVPQLGLTTLPGEDVGSAGGVGGGSKDLTLTNAKHLPGAPERTGLSVMVLTTALAVTVAWFGLRLALGSVGVLRWQCGP